MKKIVYLSFLLVAHIAFGQSPSKNYIKTRVYKADPAVQTLTPGDTLVNITYFNGLGQPIQSIAVGSGGNGQDIITPIVYENGKKIKSYLPYADAQQTVANLNYRDNNSVIASLNSYYVSKFPDELSPVAPNPYSEIATEASPFERAYKAAAPGEAWKLSASGNDRSIKTDIYVNEEDDRVFRFKVNFITENSSVRTDTTSLALTGYYAPGDLVKVITRNENWDGNYDNRGNTTEEYTDNLGHLVLKRAFNGNQPHDTYYVYDKFDNLTYVLPPLAADQILDEAFITNPVGASLPWERLAVVDQELADEYEHDLRDYNSPTVLAADLLDKYGATGGFSLLPDANGNLTLSINIQANTPMPYRTGTIADLKDIGTFPDMEIGRIKAAGYEYIFSIVSNGLSVSGSGNVPSISATLTSGGKLSYTKNYHWSQFVDNITPGEMEQYNTLTQNVPNEQLNITYIENAYGALGGITLGVDADNNVDFSIDVTAATAVTFKTGTVFPLDISRSIADRVLGTLKANNGDYEFSIKSNFLVITGSGEVTSARYTANRPGNRFLINQKPLQGLCYIYHYDKRNRQIEKHIPDKGWSKTVYDKLNRPVLVQDENLRIKTSKNWLYTKYDLWNRVVYSGEYTDARSRKDIQQAIDSDTTTPLNETRIATDSGLFEENAVFYTRNAFPATGTQLSVTYYDDYTFIVGRPGGIPEYNLYGDKITTNVKGLTTCTKVNVLGTNQWETSEFYYEERGLLISTQYANQYLATSDVTDQHINFAGQTLAAKRRHVRAGTTLIVEDLYTYNHAGQVLKQTEKINGGAEQLIAFNKYNELGTLIEKKVGGTPATTYNGVTGSLQTIKYAYTLRGWLKGINNPDASLAATADNDLFAFKLNYTTIDFSGEALFNGNIAESVWRSKTDNKKRGYSYHYDAMNRLTDANYVGEYELAQYPGQTENYTEGNIQYDKQGNIIHLERYGLKVNTIDKIDDLSYVYMPYSNKLLSVSDAASASGFNNGTTEELADYSYDLNGNLISDANKKITNITYNYLDLPVKVQRSATQYINYTYNAAGGKVEKKYSDGESITTTQYANGFVYQNGVLQYFPHAEGYVQKDSNGNFVYVYQYKDHLGNVRLSYFKNTATNALEVVEEENYYAFGMKHQGYNNVTSSNANNVAQKIEFNGKEYQDELSLNWYDYGARNYDPTIGRWFNVDPLAEKYRKWTPYNYCMNNPVYFIDPDGMSVNNYEGAAAWELVAQMQANMDRAERHQFITDNYGWPTGFESFTGINMSSTSGGGFSMGEIMAGTEGIAYTSVEAGPFENGYHEKGAKNGEILDYNMSLLDRFKDSGIDPFAPVRVNDRILEAAMKVINKVKGLKSFYLYLDSPALLDYGSSTHNYRGFTPPDGNAIELFNGAFTNYFILASTIFHEFFHYNAQKFGLNNTEHLAYGVEWKLGDLSLKKNYKDFYKSVWAVAGDGSPYKY